MVGGVRRPSTRSSRRTSDGADRADPGGPPHTDALSTPPRLRPAAPLASAGSASRSDTAIAATSVPSPTWRARRSTLRMDREEQRTPGDADAHGVAQLRRDLASGAPLLSARRARRRGGSRARSRADRSAPSSCGRRRGPSEPARASPTRRNPRRARPAAPGRPARRRHPPDAQDALERLARMGVRLHDSRREQEDLPEHRRARGSRARSPISTTRCARAGRVGDVAPQPRDDVRPVDLARPLPRTGRPGTAGPPSAAGLAERRVGRRSSPASTSPPRAARRARRCSRAAFAEPHGDRPGAHGRRPLAGRRPHRWCDRRTGARIRGTRGRSDGARARAPAARSGASVRAGRSSRQRRGGRRRRPPSTTSRRAPRRAARRGLRRRPRRRGRTAPARGGTRARPRRRSRTTPTIPRRTACTGPVPGGGRPTPSSRASIVVDVRTCSKARSNSARLGGLSAARRKRAAAGSWLARALEVLRERLGRGVGAVAGDDRTRDRAMTRRTFGTQLHLVRDVEHERVTESQVPLSISMNPAP